MNRTRISRFASAALVLAISAFAMAQISIIPKPLRVEPKSGSFTLTAETAIVASGDAVPVGRMAQDMLESATGFEFTVVKSARGPAIRFKLDGNLGAALGEEGYRLNVSERGVDVVAAKRAGLFYGLQSILQLAPAAIYSKSKASATWSIPACEIEDKPRFAWRGAHMDVARHFMPKEFVFKFLDTMAMHKLNVFHFHLTDDQGWRIEIKRYPKLTEVGAWRKDTMLTYSPATYSGKPHGGFYTQSDLKQIVAYAAARNITVVPEIEMPGHAQAAIAAYPELGNGDLVDVFTKWGVNPNVFNVKDSTIEFLQNVLVETMEIFPSKFIHIGGDECPKEQWKASAFAQEKMKRLGLKDEHEMQSWFVRQMDQFLEKKGRRLIGWSEILEGGLAPGAALMVWLGDEGALQAAGSGHDVVMAQTTYTYLDYYQAKDRTKEPHAIGGFLPLDKVYQYDPVLPKMTPEMAKHVMGAQFQLWSEYIRDPQHMEYMAFPRGCALAEVAWTDPKLKNYDDFLARMKAHTARLDALGVNYRKLD